MAFHEFRCYEHEDYEPDDAKTYTAYDAEEAARLHGKDVFNNGDGWEWMHQTPAKIAVICPDGTTRKFEVTAESVPYFRVEEEDSE